MKKAASGGEDAEQEEVAPGLIVVDGVEEDQVGRRGEGPADGVGALQDAHGAPALLGLGVLGEKSGANGPLGAEGEAVEGAPEKQLLEVLGGGREGGEDRVAEDHEGEDLHAAEAVGQRAADHAAEGGGDEAEGDDEGAVGRRKAERHRDRRQRVGEHRPVEAVEAPAETRGDEGALALVSTSSGGMFSSTSSCCGGGASVSAMPRSSRASRRQNAAGERACLSWRDQLADARRAAAQLGESR